MIGEATEMSVDGGRVACLRQWTGFASTGAFRSAMVCPGIAKCPRVNLSSPFVTRSEVVAPLLL